MKAASTANAMTSGQYPWIPMTVRTASIPSRLSAMYGMVATMPVMATASASVGEPNRPRTKSAVVT